MSGKGFKQEKGGKWPSGKDQALAVLRQEPEELTQTLAIDFRDGADELGSYKEAALLLPSGRQVLLIRWVLSDNKGTEVLVDSSDDSTSAFEEVLDSLGLLLADIQWVNGDVKGKPSS